MDVKKWLTVATKTLEPESGTAQLDAEVILAFVLNVDRSWIHAHHEEIISDKHLVTLNNFLKRRALHEPLAYILEKTEFYGRAFYITNGVLVPRPESETMIDLCKKHCTSSKLDDFLLIDVGTGSGALIISAVLETQITNALAIDIDEKCLEVTKKNIASYKLNINLTNGDLLSPLIEDNLANKHLFILANLPYVPDKYAINVEARNEPSHAIFGGSDGLDLYRKLFQQLDDLNPSSITLFTESLPMQHEGLKNIALGHHFIEIETEDFIQVFSR